MTPRSPFRCRRRGIALLVTLLAILVLEVIAAGVFHVAIQQVRTARAGAEALRLQLAAHSAAVAGLQAWDPDSLEALPIDGIRSFTVPSDTPLLQATVTVRRVDTTLYLLRAEVAARPGGRSGLGIVVRTARVADYLAATPAAAAVAGRIDGSGHIASTPQTWCGDSATSAQVPALALADSSALLALPHVTDGQVVVDEDLDVGAAPAGVELAVLATTIAPGRYVLDTADSPGACAGFPADDGESPGIPCATHFPVLRIPGDLYLDEGAGQGMLLVEGDAVLAPGTRYDGLLVVRGSLSLLGDAAVSGAVRVGGDLRLEGGTITFDPCAIARAVRQGRGTRGPFRPAGHWWLPL